MDIEKNLIINGYIKQIKEGDRSGAVEALYEELNAYLIFNATKYFDNKQDIEDAVLEFWANIVKYCDKMKNFQNGKAYLIKCFNNQCLMRLRKEKKNYVISFNQQIAIGDQFCESEDDNFDFKIAFDKAIAKLDEKERRVFYMIKLEGYTTREVAKEIGLSKSQVSRLNKKALEILRKELSKEGWDK